jgi:thiamine biosynthesis lipoprotein
VPPLLLLLLALSTPRAEVFLSETRPVFGSVATVAVAAGDPARVRVGIEAAFAQLDRVGWAMNEWSAESPLSALNASAGGDFVELPADLCGVLRTALEGARRTRGLFDPTWAALSDLWRFDGTGTVPPADALRARCALVDPGGLQIRPGPRGGCEARLARPGMRVGLGGIAKGHALDAAARALRALGLRDFLLQAGGDLYAGGRRAGAPWRVAASDPRHPGRAVAAVDLSDEAFSTTADTEHAFEEGGRRFHHVIDPRTCAPATASRSVTVLARSAVDAEIVGKAAFVAGGREALEIARAFGAAILVVDGAGEAWASPEIEPRLRPSAAGSPPPVNAGLPPHPRARAPGRAPRPARRSRRGAPPRRAAPPRGRRRRRA